jgi:hypothetical protein
MEAGILDRAKQMTESIFQPLRLEIRWVDCVADPTPQNQRCISPAGPNDISVRIYRRSANERERLGHKTAGVALPSSVNGGSGFVQVYFDRLEEIWRDSRGEAALGLLLGMTITHEMGHLLLPENQHSPSGIMQRCTGARNLQLAARGWLSFTPVQRQTIGDNVRKWSGLPEGEQLALLQR